MDISFNKFALMLKNLIDLNELKDINYLYGRADVKAQYKYLLARIIQSL